jgi:hypothetical protein
MGSPNRPYSMAGDSVHTIATADLQATPRLGASNQLPYSDSGYNMGDYAAGGNGGPYPPIGSPAYPPNAAYGSAQ